MSSAQYLMQSHLPTGDVRLQPKESTTAEAYKNYRISSLPPSSKVDAYKSTLRIGDKGGLNPETTSRRDFPAHPVGVNTMKKTNPNRSHVPFGDTEGHIPFESTTSRVAFPVRTVTEDQCRASITTQDPGKSSLLLAEGRHGRMEPMSKTYGVGIRNASRAGPSKPMGTHTKSYVPLGENNVSEFRTESSIQYPQVKSTFTKPAEKPVSKLKFGDDYSRMTTTSSDAFPQYQTRPVERASKDTYGHTAIHTDAGGDFSTTTSSSFPGHAKGEREDVPSAAFLRATHFALAANTHDPNPTTTSASAFRSTAGSQRPAPVIKHKDNISLGDDRLPPQMQSTVQSAFHHHYQQTADTAIPSNKHLKSSFSLACDQRDTSFQTTSRQNFPGHPASMKPQKQHIANGKAAFDFGDSIHNTMPKTTTADAFQSKRIVAHVTDEKALNRNLQVTHFAFSGDERRFETTSGSDFSKQPIRR